MRRIVRRPWRTIIVSVIALLGAAAGHAQERRDALEALERERTQQIRDAQLCSTPQGFGAGAVAWQAPVAGETPCFPIRHVEWLAAPARFQAVLSDLGAFTEACLGVQGLERLRRNLEARLAALGYVTSSVGLPAQNLADGTLRLQLHLGRIARIEKRGPAAAISGNALAVHAGEVLDLRDVEQSLENLSRLPSQAAQVQIEAAESADESVLVLAAAGGRRWRIGVGADNAGTRDFGRWQASAQLVLDAPLGLSDQLSAYIAGPAHGGGRRYQRTGIASYSIPWGRHLFSLSGSRSEHARPIPGLSTDFSEHGHDSSLQAKWQWTAWRSANARWAVWLGATQRRTRNFIDDVELLLQRRNLRSNDWGLNGWWRQALGEFQLDYERAVGIRQPLGDDFAIAPPPLTHTARAQLSWQHDAGRWRHEVRLAWAGVRDPASGADLQALGSRWTVRGFDAQGLLSGTEQLTLKQDWRGPGVAWRAGWACQPYAALDLGRIAGSPLAGRTLAGAAAGLRIQAGGLSGDLALAAPLHKPQGFDAASAVLYASFNATY
ncbi:MAG: ShlB/FhaC/HecB family hemolysin secretion/activation protein [Roseateles sp.]|uniref:ShlB/FhaC/HecB family hemolysin secretion/activation protein n=1 Tax=Roseateles sp. TaxID=1971397 RepID=UPI0039ECFB9F